jgi:phosphatidylserine decarboxylase
VIQGQKIRVIMKQIAGILARRIVCYSREGDVLKSGQKIGLIQFGSRVDLYLPISIEMNVKIGDKVRGGASILAVLK